MPEDCFFTQALRSLLDENLINRKMSLLVLCGDRVDVNILRSLEFENVVISNVDVRIEGNEFFPYSWSFQDAENLSFEDKSFDFGLVHHGLHHCYSPHKALLELVRVTRKGLLLFEPYDNVLSRIGISIEIGQEFEHAAVFYNECKFGGVKNSALPNYIYRWTEKEIKKTINAFNVHGKSQFRFIYKMVIPWIQLNGRRKWWISYLVKIALPFLRIITFFFPRQSNNFAAVIFHPRIQEDLYPWLKINEGKVGIDPVWLNKQYK